MLYIFIDPTVYSVIVLQHAFSPYFHLILTETHGALLFISPPTPFWVFNPKKILTLKIKRKIKQGKLKLVKNFFQMALT